MSCALAAIFCLLIVTKADAACRENDLSCFREGFLERGKQIDSLAAEIKLKDQLIGNQQAQITTLTTSNDQLNGALQDTRKTLPMLERKVWESPVLWLGIGFTVGVLSILGAAAAVHALH